MIIKKERIPVPVRESDYVCIYTPQADIYNGVKTKSFIPGKRYDKWIPNDFSVLKRDGEWHMVGITHPAPKGFIDGFDREEDCEIHEGEFQLFHCKAKGELFSEVFRENSFEECEKMLYPQSRPGEANEIWAPHIMEHGGKIKIVYSPWAMRLAESVDFKHWETGEILFTGESDVARDPYIFSENGVFYILYVEGNRIDYRTSADLKNWSEAKVLQVNPFLGAASESPFLMRRGEYLYLFWCIWDGRNGAYDNRTFVFAAKTLEELSNTAPIAMLDAHAPEIICDENGECFILSVFYPHGGISAARLRFEE